jgi:hypothetical protein
MASRDHVQQFCNGNSTSTGGSSSENDSSSSDEQQDEQEVPMNDTLPTAPPKMRIKLSLRMPNPTPSGETVASTPPKAKAAMLVRTAVKREEDASVSSQNEDDDDDDDDDIEDEEIVQAAIVNSCDEEVDGNANDDDEDTVHVEAEPIASMSTSPVPSSSAPSKKRASQPARAVRLPPISSPGLLIPPSAVVYQVDVDANGFTTPAFIFDYCMSLAGYTTQERTENPHRGSSVRRVVGDMFDSDVSFALHFPPLVPKELWNLPVHDQESAKDGDGKAQNSDQDAPRDAAQLLLRALAPPGPKKEHALAKTDMGTEQAPPGTTSKTSRKRRRPWNFSEMAPLSLTLPYPEPYIQKRLRYIEKVQERERAIVASQQAAEKAEAASERHELRVSTGKDGEVTPPPSPEPIQVPPIPEPPSPPRFSEVENESKKSHEKLTCHIDPLCINPGGRYFGLMTNSIADPNFVGPNAPGSAGLNVSGGTGLATAYAGSTSSGPSASALSAVYYGSVGGGSSSSTPKPAATKNPPKKNSTSPSLVQAAANGGGKKNAARSGPPPTCTSADLKKLMDENGDVAQEMREIIIRAAVYASRIGKHGQSFLGPNGEAYPDVSKAFAAHAGLRPCSRCKNNKQGVSQIKVFNVILYI